MKGPDTKMMIIEKSMQLFSRKGFYNTSIGDIQDATGLTRGGLYGHYKSKEDIWFAVYNRAVELWRSIVFDKISEIEDPVKRIEKVIESDMYRYLGKDVFDGGCFFLNSLVELSGQSENMSSHITRGFMNFSRLIRNWLEEAKEGGKIADNHNLMEVSNFIVISLNGAAALYAARKDGNILKQTVNQLKIYLRGL